MLRVKVDDQGQIRVEDLCHAFREATGSTLSTPIGTSDEFFVFGRGEEDSLWIAKRLGVVSDYSYSDNLLSINLTQPDPAESLESSYDLLAETFGLEQYRLFFAPKSQPQTASSQILVLIHGLHCSSQDLLPLGQTLVNEEACVAYFEYPNRGGLARAAKEFASRLVDLQQSFFNSSIKLIRNNMGGLVARSVAAVPREPFALEIRQVITIGTPHRDGSVKSVGHLLTIISINGERKSWLRVAGRSNGTSSDIHAELLTEAQSRSELLSILAAPELDSLQSDGAVSAESVLRSPGGILSRLRSNHIDMIRFSETDQPNQEVVVYIRKLLDTKSITRSR
ncbi:MAG: hypothetical protein Q8M16_09260 [Pirellulaceae bacterium]|nr:hypothetical protein [Pirellulaceae bacterium]